MSRADCVIISVLDVIDVAEILEVNENVVVGTLDGDTIPVDDARAVKSAEAEIEGEQVAEAVTEVLGVTDFDTRDDREGDDVRIDEIVARVERDTEADDVDEAAARVVVRALTDHAALRVCVPVRKADRVFEDEGNADVVIAFDVVSVRVGDVVALDECDAMEGVGLLLTLSDTETEAKAVVTAL